MDLREILMLPAQVPQKLEAYLPSGAPSISAMMIQGASKVPQVGSSSTAFNLPKLAPIIASVEEHIPHPRGMEMANAMQKIESPVVARVESFIAGKNPPAAPPAPQGLIPLSFE